MYLKNPWIVFCLDRSLMFHNLKHVFCCLVYNNIHPCLPCFDYIAWTMKKKVFFFFSQKLEIWMNRNKINNHWMAFAKLKLFLSFRKSRWLPPFGKVKMGFFFLPGPVTKKIDWIETVHEQSFGCNFSFFV